MRSPNVEDVKKNKNGKAWHQKKDKEHLKNVNMKYNAHAAQSQSKGCEAGSPAKGRFDQGTEMANNGSQPATVEMDISDGKEGQDSAEKDPIVTVEKPDTAGKTNTESKKRQHVNLMHSSSDRNNGGPNGGFRGGPRNGPRGGPRGGSRGGPRGGPRGGSLDGVRGSLSSRGRLPAQGTPNIPEDPYQQLEYFDDGFHQPSNYADSGYGFAEYDEAQQGSLNSEEYGFGYDYGAPEPYSYGEGPGYGYDHSYQEVPPSKRHRSQEYCQEEYYEVEPPFPDPPGYRGRGRAGGAGGPPRGRGRGSGPPPFRGSVHPPVRGAGAPSRGFRHPSPQWGAAPRARGRGSRRPY